MKKKLTYKNILLLCSVVTLFFFFACKPAADKYSGPEDYDFDKPEKFNMPESLLEISGITFRQGDGKVIYAVQDENGNLYKLNWAIKKQVHVKFGRRGDYEDLAIMKDTVYVLKSSGAILAFPLDEFGKEETTNVKEWKHVLPKGEYEGLYADQQTQTLFALCKECDVDKKTKNTSGYHIKVSPDRENITIIAEFKIAGEEIEALDDSIKSGLKPSALAKNPKTGDWFIISSVRKLLVIADQNFKVKALHKLSPSRFNQPEGIAFDKGLNLYISNEGDELHSGNILKFAYNPAK